MLKIHRLRKSSISKFFRNLEVMGIRWKGSLWRQNQWEKRIGPIEVKFKFPSPMADP